MTPIDTCTWDTPGADRYTGTVPAAIAAYGLPLATQSALIAAFERREFGDSVVIDRDSIRGTAHEYDAGIRAMHFGSRGRVCGNVSRSGWSADHIETALVVCAAGECIAWPAVCGNVFRLQQRPVERDPAGERSMVPGGDPALGAPAAPFALPGDPTGAGSAAPGAIAEGTALDLAAFALGGFYAPGGVAYGPCCISTAPGAPASPIPEPSIALGLVGGGLLLIARQRRRAPR